MSGNLTKVNIRSDPVFWEAQCLSNDLRSLARTLGSLSRRGSLGGSMALSLRSSGKSLAEMLQVKWFGQK